MLFLENILWAILIILANAVQAPVSTEPKSFDCRSYPMRAGTTLQNDGTTTFWDGQTVVLEDGDIVTFLTVEQREFVSPVIWLRSDEQFALRQTDAWGYTLKRSDKIEPFIESDVPSEAYRLYMGQMGYFELEASSQVSMTLTPMASVGHTESVYVEPQVCTPQW